MQSQRNKVGANERSISKRDTSKRNTSKHDTSKRNTSKYSTNKRNTSITQASVAKIKRSKSRHVVNPASLRLICIAPLHNCFKDYVATTKHNIGLNCLCCFTYYWNSCREYITNVSRMCITGHRSIMNVNIVI